MVDAAGGARALQQLSRSLQQTEALAAAYAEAVLQEAQQKAAGKPTPQSRMAAENLIAEGDTIRVLTGGAPAAVYGGSEYGSVIYKQFGPRNEQGYWLHPAADEPSARTDEAVGEWMDRAMFRAGAH